MGRAPAAIRLDVYCGKRGESERPASVSLFVTDFAVARIAVSGTSLAEPCEAAYLKRRAGMHQVTFKVEARAESAR